MQIQLFKPIFDKEEILKEIGECLDNSWTGLGYKTVQFENDFKSYTGLRNVHFLNSATSGLHLALEIIKIKEKLTSGYVLTTPLTFISSTHVIKHAGMEPVFVDVDDYLCMDPTSLHNLMEDMKYRPAAVIYTGIGGNTGMLNSIASICRKYRVPLILDASHMMGTYYIGIHVGSEADFTVFSFQAVKNLPTADSGMLVCKEEDDDKKARKLSWLGIDKDTYSRQIGGGNWDYNVDYIGYKYHGNSIMAAMALVGLRYLRTNNHIRRLQAIRYTTSLKDNYTQIPMAPYCESSRHLFQVRVPSTRRDYVINKAREKGIQLGVHYKHHGFFTPYIHTKYYCLNAESFSKQLISLPIGPHLSEKDVNYVIEVMNEIKF